MKRLFFILMILFFASCDKEESIVDNKMSRPYSYNSISIDVDSMTEIHDSATLGEMDSADYWEWYHLLFGYDIVSLGATPRE